VNRHDAHVAVALSAVWVAIMFGYRKLTPSDTELTSTAHFVIGFAFTFIVLSVIGEAAPDLGGMMAILVATGDTLVNGEAFFSDVTKALKATSTATATVAPATSTSTEQPEQG
jgi:hypothetical protein